MGIDAAGGGRCAEHGLDAEHLVVGGGDRREARNQQAEGDQPGAGGWRRGGDPATRGNAGGGLHGSAGIQPVTVWQDEQSLPEAMCPGCLPGATTPLWQLKHEPSTEP